MLQEIFLETGIIDFDNVCIYNDYFHKDENDRMSSVSVNIINFKKVAEN